MTLSVTARTARDQGEDRQPGRPSAFRLRSHQVQFIAIVIISFIVGNCAGVSSLDSTASGQMIDEADATAIATVGSETFPFRPSNCSATPEQFLAEGPGANETSEYYVTVAQDEVSIRLGADSASDEGDSDLPAWEALGMPLLTADGTEISGRAVFVNARGDLTAEQDGEINITCPAPS